MDLSAKLLKSGRDTPYSLGEMIELDDTSIFDRLVTPYCATQSVTYRQPDAVCLQHFDELRDACDNCSFRANELFENFSLFLNHVTDLPIAETCSVIPRYSRYVFKVIIA